MKHSNFKTNVHNLVLAAMFLALALVLPFLTGQIPQIGGMLLPMHLPVFLCGLICGWRYGAVVGFVAPLMRMALFGCRRWWPLWPWPLSWRLTVASRAFCTIGPAGSVWWPCTVLCWLLWWAAGSSGLRCGW